MSDKLETVVITTDNGPVLLNKSDYDANPKGYKLAKDQTIAPAAPAQTEQQEPQAPRQMGVSKDGDKVFVIYTDDQSKVAGVAEVSEDGYADEGAAWAAVAAAVAAQKPA